MANVINTADNYDIFISYRRDGGETMAILLHDRLTSRGYRVFLDVESLNAGKFNEKLLYIIENCKDFIIILSENSLERCVNEDDWVRREISHAFSKEKNIVPFILRRFQWPESLPADIAGLPAQNGINAIGNEYFDASIERLTQKFLKSTPHGIKLKVPAASTISRVIIAFIIAIAVITVVALIVVAVFFANNPDLLNNIDSLQELINE